MPTIDIIVIKPNIVVAMMKHGLALSRGKASDRIRHMAKSIM